MSGVGFSEFLILCLIGLIVLGPKRLPQVASQIGSWVGQARRMTRVMKRQLEEELNFDEDFNIMPNEAVDKAPAYTPPRDDDDYSPLHEQPDGNDGKVANAAASVADAAVDEDSSVNAEADAKDSDDDEHDAKS